MSNRNFQLTFLVVLLLAVEPVSAEQLSRNPFSPPTDYSAAGNPQSSAPLASGTQPVIRGIIAAGDQSLVNLGGQLIGVGEIASGYRLLKVGEEHAIFQRGDQVITLSLYPDEDNAD